MLEPVVQGPSFSELRRDFSGMMIPGSVPRARRNAAVFRAPGAQSTRSKARRTKGGTFQRDSCEEIDAADEVGISGVDP